MPGTKLIRSGRIERALETIRKMQLNALDRNASSEYLKGYDKGYERAMSQVLSLLRDVIE